MTDFVFRSRNGYIKVRYSNVLLSRELYIKAKNFTLLIRAEDKETIRYNGESELTSIYYPKDIKAYLKCRKSNKSTNYSKGDVKWYLPYVLEVINKYDNSLSIYLTNTIYKSIYNLLYPYTSKNYADNKEFKDDYFNLLLPAINPKVRISSNYILPSLAKKFSICDDFDYLCNQKLKITGAIREEFENDIKAFKDNHLKFFLKWGLYIKLKNNREENFAEILRKVDKRLGDIYIEYKHMEERALDIEKSQYINSKMIGCRTLQSKLKNLENLITQD